jgi:hypothetical protein
MRKPLERPGLFSALFFAAYGTLILWGRRTRDNLPTLSENPTDMPPPPRITVHAELHTPEHIERERSRYDRSNNHLQRWLVGGTFLGFIVAAVYAGLTYRMFRQMQTQTDTAHRQLEATERPWVKIDFKIGVQGLTFDAGGFSLPLEAVFNNIGHSTATSAFAATKMFLASGNAIFTEPIKRQHDLCDPLRKLPVRTEKMGDMMLTIFPSDADASMTYGQGVGQPELDATPNFEPPPPGGKRIVPIIVGCVDYQYDASDRHHQTRFIYEVQRLDRAAVAYNDAGQRSGQPFTPHAVFYSIEVPKHLAPEDVVLVKYGFGGFAAD